MAGPYCAMLLSDMGATVIKVEPPGGDSTRAMAGARGADSEAFNAVNRGKLGIVLDLKHPTGRDALRRLARTADVFVENFRPGAMGRVGLDYPALAAENPRLVYASISGYGQTGPAAPKGGFDLVAQGAAGLLSVTGHPGGPPAKCGVPVTDLGAALFALAGILAALCRRAVSGRGQHIDTSLLEAGIALSVWEATEYLAGRGVPGPLGTAHRMSAPYQAFRCADGHVTIGAANDRSFARLAALLGHPEWTADPRFATDARRVEHRDELATLIERVTVTAPAAEWLQRLEEAGVPCGPIHDYAAVFADPQVVAREMVVEVDHPSLGRIRALGTPLKLSETPLDPRRPAPRLGEHTDQVLADAGFSAGEIAALRAAGAAA